MPRRGRSTTIGKIGKLHQERRVSEIRILGELLRREQGAEPVMVPPPQDRCDAASGR